jgi:hypothetical protein
MLVPEVAHKHRLVIRDGSGSLVHTEPASDTEALFGDPPSHEQARTHG